MELLRRLFDYLCFSRDTSDDSDDSIASQLIQCLKAEEKTGRNSSKRLSTDSGTTIGSSLSHRLKPPRTRAELQSAAYQYVRNYNKSRYPTIHFAMLGLRGVGKTSLISRVS
jgi:hypothetical protein